MTMETPDSDPAIALVSMASEPGDVMVLGTGGGHPLRRARPRLGGPVLREARPLPGDPGAGTRVGQLVLTEKLCTAKVAGASPVETISVP